MSKSRQFGSMLIIAGTTVGAGMLALPMISAGEGFPYAILLLTALWAIMLFGALLILEVNLLHPHGSSFSTLSRETLGRPGQWVTNVCMVLLFYCLSAAYVSGGASLLASSLQRYFHINFPNWASACIFILIFGGLVSWKTSAVDVANRLLLALKMLAFFTVFFLLVPHVNYQQLGVPTNGARYMLMAIPIFFTAFGFHGSIPSIVKYIGHDAYALRRIFIIGSAIPLILYIFWEWVAIGILPQHGPLSFSLIAHHKNSVELFVGSLSAMIGNKGVNFGINFFTDIAMTTSFLGVNLGLFDFFSDIFKPLQKSWRKLIVCLITFMPPLFFAIFYPKGFIVALGYASIPLALLAIILPAIMVWCSRRSGDSATLYRVSGGMVGISLILLIGCGVITLQILSSTNVLPKFS